MVLVTTRHGRLLAGVNFFRRQFQLSERRETGRDYMMEVHCDQGAAVCIGAEACAVPREGISEASLGAPAGRPLSRVSSPG